MIISLFILTLLLVYSLPKQQQYDLTLSLLCMCMQTDHYDKPIIDHHQYKECHYKQKNKDIDFLTTSALYLTITPEDVVKIVEVEDIRCVGVIKRVLWVHFR